MVLAAVAKPVGKIPTATLLLLQVTSSVILAVERSEYVR